MNINQIIFKVVMKKYSHIQFMNVKTRPNVKPTCGSGHRKSFESQPHKTGQASACARQAQC